MKIKTSIATGLTIILITVVSIFLIPILKVQGNQNFVQTEIPVVIKPLKVGNEIVPVEIQCKPVFITRPDTLDRFSCILINRTNKAIRAYSVRYSIIVDSNGKEEQDDRFDTVDTFIHPDLDKVKKAIVPGGSLPIVPISTIERDSVIKRLELQPVYIEFTDGTTVGDSDSAVMIAKVRAGALRFKNNLRQEFINKGGNVQAILPLLEDNAPLGLENLSYEEKTGAKFYRRFLLRKYQKSGAASVINLLNNSSQQ